MFHQKSSIECLERVMSNEKKLSTYDRYKTIEL